MPKDFKSCREEIAGALQEFCNRWCKREHVESNALNSWKLNIFKIIEGRISFTATISIFYHLNLNSILDT